MSTITKNKANTYRLTGLGILTAIIIVLQIFSTFVKFGPFSITLALIPIVVGAAMYGKGAGAYLGAVLGVVVTIMSATGGDVGGFMVWSANPFLCAVLCITKTAVAGFLAGLLYQLIAPKNKLIGVIFAALISPIANTGIFIAGMLLFFRETLASWAGNTDLFTYIIFFLTGVNFLIELGVNLVLSPVVVKIIEAVNKSVPHPAKDDSKKYGFQYFISFIVPLVGYILGAILLSKDSDDQKAVGKNCLILAVTSTVFAAVISLLAIFLK